MAMQLGGGGGVKSDINVTPLVDVMLVLLIIMMIVAPLLQQGVSVKLPHGREHHREARDAGPDGARDRLEQALCTQRRAGADTATCAAQVEEVLEGKKEQHRHHQGR